MSIAIRLNSNRTRRWHLQFQKTLKSKAATDVVWQFHEGDSVSRSIELLLDLERLVYARPAKSSIDPASPREFILTSDNTDPGWIVDLSGDCDAPQESGLKLTPLFNGIAGEDALLHLLVNGCTPVIEIQSSPSQQVILRAAPALDEARSVRERFEYVVGYIQRMLLSALSGPHMALPRHSYELCGGSDASQVVRHIAGVLSSAALRRAYQLCLFSPHWRVGWRMIEDEGVWERASLGGEKWNSINDNGFRFYADPFPMTFKGLTAVLVEDFDHRDGKGIISSIPFDETGQIGPAVPVLSEPWHLSYPFVFQHLDQVWMIPESSQARKISLYRADPFPSRWVHVADLITDIDASDASIVQFEEKWWIFTTVRDELGGAMDSLCLYFSHDLLGPWIPHRSNPVLIDVAQARQAGQFLRRGGTLWRPVQDCRGGYGRAIGLAEVTCLNQDDFGQTVHTVLSPNASWPGRRLHTLNRFGRLECIDGSRNSPKLKAAWLGR